MAYSSKLIVLVVAMAIMFFGPRLLTRYFESQRFNPLTIAMSKIPTHIFSLEVVRILVSNAQEITPMIAAAFVVVSVAVLVRFGFKVHSHLVKEASLSNSATPSVNVIALFTIAPTSKFKIAGNKTRKKLYSSEF